MSRKRDIVDIIMDYDEMTRSNTFVKELYEETIQIVIRHGGGLKALLDELTGLAIHAKNIDKLIKQ